MNSNQIVIRFVLDGTGEEIVISDQDFIDYLLRLGFQEGRNDSPERMKTILQNVPPEHLEAFMSGFNAKPR